MGFDKILSRWVAKGRTGDSSKIRRALTDLKRNHARLIVNLDTSPNIKDRDREALCDLWLSKRPHLESELVDVFLGFCRGAGRRKGMKMKGPGDPVGQTACLGHTMTVQTFKSRIESVGNAKSPMKRRGSGSAPTVRTLLKLDLKRQMKRLRSTALGRFLMWSFYDPDSLVHPFTGIGKSGSELRRRLGLGHIREGEEMVLFAHRLSPGVAAHTPTTFDAEDSPFYRPGGRTQPLDTSTTADGMPEVVHSPITGSTLAEPIQSTV